MNGHAHAHQGSAGTLVPSPVVRRAALGTAALLVASMLSVLGVAAPAQAATPAPRNGLTSTAAAPSCWSIKQSFPASADGIYWLRTTTLIAPQQFYCDMTTDGGGWVLIGRGRDGWSFPYWGQGSASTLRNTREGTAAFSPASLSTPVVDGLLNGGRMDALVDGIRIRRAKDQAGTTWQEVRQYPKTYGSWSWAFGGGIYLSKACFDASCTTFSTSNYRTNTTADTNIDNGFQRVVTYPVASHNYRTGFAYGSSVAGVNSSTSYLWQYTTEKSAIPFAQVFVRPRITEADLASAAVTAPSSGLPAQTVRPMIDWKPQATNWGVTGFDPGTAVTGNNAYVLAFAQLGDTVYVGGKFLQVQNGVGGPKYDQKYLAAFNKNTGEWISTFRPVLDGPVWEMTTTPDGKLIVGGEFTNINGATNSGTLAALNGTTGQVRSDWVATFSGGSSTQARPFVRALDIRNGWLYVAGNFTRMRGGVPITANITNSRIARVRLTDGRPDGTWKPNVETAPWDINASAQGDRVYAVGNFRKLNGVTLPVPRLAVIDATTAQAVPNLQSFKNNSDTEFQQAILEVGDAVFQGGSQHILHKYNRSDYSFVRGHMAKNGGDFQAISYTNGIVYASCHCNNWQYQDSNSWPDPVGYSEVNQITYTGAYDAATFEVLPEFTPTLKGTGAGSEGPWDQFVDSDGSLWLGGDIQLQSTSGAYYGGFFRFNQRDTTAPSVPGNQSATLAGGTATVRWNASTDNAPGSTQYEILRDDPDLGTIVVGTSYSTSFTESGVSTPTRYFVRALDVAGNRSATGAALALLSGPDTTAPSQPGNLRSTSTTSSTVNLAWDASSDNVGVTGYRVSRGGVLLGTVTSTSFSDTTVSGSTPYTYSVVAVDAANLTSTPATLTLTTPAGADLTPPTAPGNLRTTGVSQTTAQLAWDASSDNVGVTGYRVSRDGTLLGTVSGTTYSDSGLAASTTYQYSVVAVDAAANTSDAATLGVATSGATDFNEAWTRADGSAWGSSWTANSTQGVVDVQGNQGRLGTNDVTGAYARALLSGSPATANTDVVFSYQWSAASARQYFSAYVRGSGGWQNSYRPRNGFGIQITNDSASVLVQANVNGVTSTLQTIAGGQQVGTSRQWVRIRVVGTQLQVRMWADGQPEPATWNATITNATVPAAGQVFFSLNRAGANVGAKEIRLDDLTVAVLP